MSASPDKTASVPAKAATIAEHRELSWFAERVEKGRKGPFVEIAAITPAIARRLLEANEGNRPLSERQVAQIAADIEHGFWQLNGETVIVSEDGMLNDGQNRLAAVVKADIPIRTAITFGAPRASRMTVDMGRQRTTGNFLAMEGVKYANHAAAACSLYLLYKQGRYTRATHAGEETFLTKQDIREGYSKRKKAIDAAIELFVNERFTRMVGSAPLVCAYLIIAPLNVSEAAVFFTRLLDGACLNQDSPTLWLRQRLLEREKRRNSPEKLELILRYWNAYREGRSMRAHLKTVGAYPKVNR